MVGRSRLLVSLKAPGRLLTEGRLLLIVSQRSRVASSCFPMDERRIFHIIEKLSQSVGHSWTVDKMAQEVGLSVPRFRHLFKLHAGLSPMAYIHDLRLKTAADLLRDPHNFDRIKQICAQVGITSDSHFTRDFKKKYGLTPTEWRADCFERHRSNVMNGQKCTFSLRNSHSSQ